MATNDELTVPQDDLAAAWRQTLPERLNGSDSCEVAADEADPRALRVTIRSAGRQGLECDFVVRYVDSREIAIGLTDARKDGQSADEQDERMQELIADYRRHLHETAQSLHDFTHA